MKRCLIKNQNFAGGYIPADIPKELNGYADELRLLKDVPLTYLVSDISELEEESIRFFFLDINWTDALIDGAFSIGRICHRDGISDKYMIKAATADKKLIQTPRLSKMHPNHLPAAAKNINDSGTEDYKLVSGFIMRSKLVSKMRGLHIYGYDKEGAPKSDTDEGIPLTILRLEALEDNVMLCLFHGEVYEVFIDEPKTGLCFGAYSKTLEDGGVTRNIDLRSAVDSEELGKRKGSLCIDRFTEANGRLNADALAAEIETQLKNLGCLAAERLTPSRFAFEMISIAHRAKYSSGINTKEEENG